MHDINKPLCRSLSVVLTLLLVGAIPTAPAWSQEAEARLDSLKLSYEAFDQRPGLGWRKLAAEGKKLEAAEVIDRYDKESKELAEWQRINLRFHAGQLYAIANRKDRALARFKSAVYPKEPAGSPIRWNAYVGATVAFLEGDLKKLAEHRDEIAKGPKLAGQVPNLDVVDRLIQHFGESYTVAYEGKSKTGH